MDVVGLIQQGKIKRYFRSREKLSYPGAINHITQRAPGRERLFVEESDYSYMLHLLKNSAEQFKLRFFSFVLMSNHVHLLFQLQKDNLSQAMQRLFYTYARYFNRKYQKKGHAVCGRYRQALCFDDTYLLASSIYIHINPVVAGLAKSSEDYRWSSIIPFTMPFSKQTFVDYRFVLAILDNDIESARLTYKELMNRSISIKVGNIWDDQRAIDRFRDRFLLPLRDIIDCSKNTESAIVIDSAIDDFTKHKHKRSPVSRAARMYVIAQLVAKGYTITEIAQKLEISKRTVYNIVNSDQS